MATITNADLRRQLKQVVHNNTPHMARATGENNTAVENAEATTTGAITVSTKQFKKLSNNCNSITCMDGTKATILHPMPCMKWHSLKTPDEHGEVVLHDVLEATIITIDGKHYVLGFPAKDCGVNKELEVMIDMGDTEVILNDEFCSIKTPNKIQDGVST